VIDDEDDGPRPGSPRYRSMQSYFAARDSAPAASEEERAEVARAERAATKAHWDSVFAEEWVRAFVRGDAT